MNVVCVEQLVNSCCQANRPVDLNHFVSLQINGSWHARPSSAAIFQLTLSFVYPNVGFRLTPVNAVPIIPTALSKNLSGPMSISDVQRAAKSGYVFVDVASVCIGVNNCLMCICVLSLPNIL